MPHYGPLEDKFTIKEKAFLAGDFICGVGYGIQVILYLQCAQYLWGQRKNRGRVSLCLLGYITTLLSLSTLFLFSSAWISLNIYINNRNYPGGPWAYFLAAADLPENVVLMTAALSLTILSDLLVLWRCWVVWNSSGKLVAFVVTSIPASALLASFALGIIWVWRASHFGVTYGTIYCITSLTGNFLLTILIVLRLVLHRQRILSTLPAQYAAHYVSLAAIITESAALYSVPGIAYIIAFSSRAPVYWLFLPLALSFQQIAGYLIILRVARGRAWSLDALSRSAPSEPHLTTINFNAPAFSSHADMDHDPIDIETGDPLADSTLLAGRVPSTNGTKLKTNLDHSGLHTHTEV